MLSFAMQGSIKEVLTVPMLVTAAALIAAAARERRPARSLMPIAIAAAAGFCTLGPAVGPYLAALFAGLAALWIPGRWPHRTRADLWWIGAGLAGVALLSLPVLRNLDSALAANTATLDSSEDLGNLAAPLKIWQVFGPWLSGDFRYTPDTGRGANVVLVAIAGLSVLGGALWLVRTRRWSVLLLPGSLIVASLYLLQRGGPYADAKVLMLAAPALALTGMLGAVALFRGRLRPVSLVLCAALAGGAVYSSALIYHDVSNAPHDRYEELLDLNDQLDGQGPAIFTEYDEFGKYFLRDVPSYNQPEWPHEYRKEPYHPNPLVDERRRPSLKTPLDADDLQLPYVQSVRWLIIRRSPYRSRPPANFVRRQVGRYYELWRRTTRYRVLAHRPLGPDFLTPSAPVSAKAARAAGAAAARAGGQIAYAPRARLVITRPSIAPFSRNWSVFGNYPGAVVTRGAGRLEEAFVGIPQPGRYRVWAEGSFNREIAFDVNGVKIGSTYDGLNNPGANELLGTVRLQRAVYRVHALQPGGDLTPGTGGYRSSLRHLGPIAWQPEADERLPVRTLPASQWRRLIGKRADWVEVVAR
jgi:LPXTG-motif cell wall-anchored protein